MIPRCLASLACLALLLGTSTAQEKDKSPDQQVKDLIAKYRALPAKDQSGPEGTAIVKQLKAMPGKLSSQSLQDIARLETAHNLRQIALAIHQYDDKDPKAPAANPLGSDWTSAVTSAWAQEDVVGWARETAEDFLRAVLGARGETAKMLLTAEARQSFRPSVDLPPPPGEKVKYRFQQGQMVRIDPSATPVAVAEVFREFAIETSRLAPDHDEVVFRGSLKGERQGTFTLRVVKEKDGGKWRVGFFDAVITEAPAK
jgi:hypothetical protein